jgi:hypothetical protein
MCGQIGRTADKSGELPTQEGAQHYDRKRQMAEPLAGPAVLRWITVRRAALVLPFASGYRQPNYAAAEKRCVVKRSTLARSAA